MQRTGRKGYATYRIVVQDVRQAPSSGRVIALLGNYNPHTKEVNIDKVKSKFYIENGAHPSSRVTVLLKKEGVKIPKWVEMPAKAKKVTKNTDKLRKNRPAEATASKIKPTEAKAEPMPPTESAEVSEAQEAPQAVKAAEVNETVEKAKE
jgi:small subunit ribosomal protein S16